MSLGLSSFYCTIRAQSMDSPASDEHDELHAVLFSKIWVAGMRRDKRDSKWPEGAGISMTFCILLSLVTALLKVRLVALP